MVQEWIEKHEGQHAAYVSNKREFDNVNPDSTDFLFGASHLYAVSQAAR